MKIYITRHGETVWNKEGRMQGWENSNLTEKGVDNAKRLGESLKNIDFGCIYCSPLGRAIETANCIRGNKDTRIVIKEHLKEMSFGVWEGMDHFWGPPFLYDTCLTVLEKPENGIRFILEADVSHLD